MCSSCLDSVVLVNMTQEEYTDMICSLFLARDPDEIMIVAGYAVNGIVSIYLAGML